jgi:flagellar biogenesis protein FliO
MNKRSVKIVMLLLVLGIGPAAWAQTTKGGDPTTQTVRKAPADDRRITPADKYTGWWRTIGALALVVVLIFGVRVAIRRLGPSGAAARGADVARVVWRKNLTPRHQLFLLRLGGRVLLVGTGPTGMDVLMQTSDEQEMRELLGPPKGDQQTQDKKP